MLPWNKQPRTGDDWGLGVDHNQWGPLGVDPIDWVAHLDRVDHASPSQYMAQIVEWTTPENLNSPQSYV
jgi:hypothetical protein